MPYRRLGTTTAGICRIANNSMAKQGHSSHIFRVGVALPNAIQDTSYWRSPSGEPPYSTLLAPVGSPRWHHLSLASPKWRHQMLLLGHLCRLQLSRHPRYRRP